MTLHPNEILRPEKIRMIPGIGPVGNAGAGFKYDHVKMRQIQENAKPEGLQDQALEINQEYITP